MIRQTKTTLIIGASFCSFAVALGGASNGDAPAAIKETLKARYPDQRVIDVRPAPVGGLYEVFSADNSIVYVDGSANYMFVGSLIDTRTQRDIAADRLDERQPIDFQALPFDRAIKATKGTGERQIAVFTDPDCPACAQLEKELARLSDVTIYTFLFPVADLHPQAPARARAIWCSPDRPRAWTRWMLERKEPESAACRGDPVEELQALGRRLQIRGTPTLVLGNGRRITGSIALSHLEPLLKETLGKPLAQRTQ